MKEEEEEEEEPKATREQKIEAYKKIAEWLKTADKSERERVMDMLKKRNEQKE